jgi:hypothetical protein
VAILVILVAYLLPHGHTGKTGQHASGNVTNSAVTPRH